MRKRLALVRKFISVAEVGFWILSHKQCLREMNNYNGVMEIIGGLNLYPIVRMKSTWEQIASTQIAIVEELNTLMESMQNYKNYRTALKSVRPPLLPYLGIHFQSCLILPLGVCLRDIIFADEGNPNFLDDA